MSQLENEPAGLGALVVALAHTNCALWHAEDEARCEDDLKVARAKRKVDGFNQQRNDLIEKIDDLVNATAVYYQNQAQGEKGAE